MSLPFLYQEIFLNVGYHHCGPFYSVTKKLIIGEAAFQRKSDDRHVEVIQGENRLMVV